MNFFLSESIIYSIAQVENCVARKENSMNLNTIQVMGYIILGKQEFGGNCRSALAGGKREIYDFNRQMRKW